MSSAAKKREAFVHRHFWNRLSGLLMIADGICLVLFGKYAAWDLKVAAWHVQRAYARGAERPRDK